MTTEQINHIYKAVTANGLHPMTQERFNEAAKLVLGAEKRAKVSAKAAGKTSYHNDYVAAWKDFYFRTNNIEPRFNATDGKMIKEIMTYLEKVSSTPEEALGTWQAILANYHRLEPFFRLNTDLKFINSQINKIITQLKHVTGKAQQGHNANDLRGQL